MLIAQTFCNIHFIYVWNCKNSRCYKKLQLLLDQSRLAVLLILFFFGQKKSFLWQIWQKRLLWLKSILCNHNSVITLLSTHEIILVTYGYLYSQKAQMQSGTLKSFLFYWLNFRSFTAVVSTSFTAFLWPLKFTVICIYYTLPRIEKQP